MVFLEFFYIKNKNFKDFIIINGNFCNYINTKSDPNIHQNAPFKKIFSGEHAPEPP